MARRYKNNTTKEESLYVEDHIDESLYTEPLDEESSEAEETQGLEETSIYQRPEDEDLVEDEEDADEEEEEEETEKKKGLFGFLHRNHREEDDEEDSEEEDEEENENEDEEDDEEPKKRFAFFNRHKNEEEAKTNVEEPDDEEAPFMEDSKPRFSKKMIIGVAAAAVVIIGGVIFVIRGIGKAPDGEAYVQSVSMIAGLGSSNGMNNRYTGEVEPQSSWKISLDNDLSVAKCYVKVGDVVKKGDKLFKYDTEELQLAYEGKQLEIETTKNENAELTKQIASFQNDLKTASASEKIELQTSILTNQTQIKKNEFTLKTANDDLKKTQEKIKDATVKSKMDGVVKKINEKLGQGSSSSSSDSDSESSDGDTSYMTILATGDFRIKGKINESNIASISEGDPVIVRSRVSDETWTGTISQIKKDSTADAESENSDYYYSDTAAGESTSNYNFYVSLTGDDGLLMGQHVFVELDNGQDEEQSGIWLPTAYLEIDGDNFYVWKDNKGKLKRTEVEVGEYNEMLDTYQITSGIEEDDYIAAADDTLEQNMKTTKTEPKESDEVTEDGSGDEIEEEPVNEDEAVS